MSSDIQRLMSSGIQKLLPDIPKIKGVEIEETYRLKDELVKILETISTIKDSNVFLRQNGIQIYGKATSDVIQTSTPLGMLVSGAHFRTSPYELYLVTFKDRSTEGFDKADLVGLLKESIIPLYILTKKPT